MKLHAYTNIPRSGHNIHVHAIGCTHTNRKPYNQVEPPFTINGTTKRELVEDVYPPDEYDYDKTDDNDWQNYAEDIYFAPCTLIK